MTKLFSLRAFNRRWPVKRPIFRKFLNRIEKTPPRGLDRIAAETDVEVWKEVACLSCANCCKTMSPTYNKTDLKRISAHFGMTVEAFRKKWLYKDRHGDWLNKQQPCQFLNLADNKCSIYPIRPSDCAGFPHHTKHRTKDYIHVFKQNIDYCPATFKLVEKMIERVDGQ